MDVYTVGSDGSGLKRIVSNAVSAPSWSPDGDRVAVAVSEGDGAKLYTFAADGSDPVMVTGIGAKDIVYRTAWKSDPIPFWVPNVSWSPDGSKIMYGALSVVNIDDGSVVLDTQLIRFEWVGVYGTKFVNFEDASAFSLAAWSPDGSRIAMLAPAMRADQIGYVELERYPVLYTMNSDGTDPRILVGGEGRLYNLARARPASGRRRGVLKGGDRSFPGREPRSGRGLPDAARDEGQDFWIRRITTLEIGHADHQVGKGGGQRPAVPGADDLYN